MRRWCGWSWGRRYCNWPATGIGGLSAYTGPRQHLEKSLSVAANNMDAPAIRNRPINRFDSFRFLLLTAGVADIKVLAAKICLSGAAFDHKDGGAGLALQLCLHLARRPRAADLP